MGSKTLQLYKEAYLPHLWELLTHNKKNPNKKITFLIGGFGSGKTHSLLHKVFLCHITKFNKQGKSNGWVIYPTNELAEELFVEPMKEMFERKGIQYKYNIQKHKFTTPYGTIKVYQLQVPKRIVGAELTYIAFDEMDIESWKNCEIAYKKAIGRMRGSEDCEIFIVSSPEGYHYCHHIAVEKANESTHLIHGKTTDNPYLPDGYIKLLEQNYDSRMLEAYRDGKFVNIQNDSTYLFDRSKNVKECKYNRSLPIHIGLDFNVHPFSCVLAHIYPHKPKVQVFDTITLSHAGAGDLLTQRMADTIKDKYPNEQYIIYPDASSRQRATSAAFSDFDILKMNGFQIRMGNKNPLVVNRVNSVNNMLETKLEGNQLQPNIIIDPRCKDLINDLEKVVYKKNTREIDKTSNKMITHSSDALGYLVSYLFPIIKPTLGAIDR